MKIVINASTVALGGGLTEAANLIYSLSKTQQNHDLIFLSPEIPVFSQLETPNVLWISIPGWLLMKPFRFILDRIWIPAKIKGLDPDWVYTTGNLPARIAKHKQAFLFNNPFYTRANLNGLNFRFTDKLIHSLRKMIFKSRLRFLDLMFTQTTLQQKLIIRDFHPGFPVLVLPNASIALPQEIRKWDIPHRKGSEFRLLVFTRYYPHKNLEILFEVVDLLFQRNDHTFRFITTLQENQGTGARRFLKKIRKEPYKHYFINVGYVAPEHIQSLYEVCDALLLPTLLESYSSTYADALKFGKFILTSDLKFAKEVCGDTAYYFDPHSPDSILNTMDLVKTKLTKKQEQDFEKKVIEDWNTISDKLIDNFLNFPLMDKTT